MSRLISLPVVLLLGLWLLLTANPLQAQHRKGFVRVAGTHFYIDNARYTYLGTNLWYGMHLGIKGAEGNRARLRRELDRLQALGITNLRIMAAAEGPDHEKYRMKPALQTAPGQYNRAVFKGLDYLLAQMAKRDMKAVVVLSNFWMWSGGFPQYRQWANGGQIPYPDIEGGGTWAPFIKYAQGFYTDTAANALFLDFIQAVINRRNKVTLRKYKNDPTIMAWQLANEPRGYRAHVAYRQWLNHTAAYIKALDPHHLVSTGAEGNTGNTDAGVDLLLDNQSPHIDYATTHVWIQNWQWYNPEKPTTYAHARQMTASYLADQIAKANTLGKPLVLEEFGVSRNGGSCNPAAPTTTRDSFYTLLFEQAARHFGQNGPLQGINFWSWGGEAKPADAGGMWQPGQPLIGDPPHERQGWYSVYHTDKSTLAIIAKYAKQFAGAALTEVATSQQPAKAPASQ